MSWSVKMLVVNQPQIARATAHARRALIVCALICLIAVAATSQGLGPTPSLSLDSRNSGLQQSLYPDLYRSRDVLADMVWVRQHDSVAQAFVAGTANQAITELSRLAGFKWLESNLTLTLLRYYPSVGNAEPLVVPLEGVRGPERIEAIPSGPQFSFAVIRQLAGRLLNQIDRPEGYSLGPVAGSAAMQPGSFRRDLLSFWLAIEATRKIYGASVTDSIVASRFWRRHLPELAMYRHLLAPRPAITAEQPLVTWLTDNKNVLLITMAALPDTTDSGSEPTPLAVGIPTTGALGWVLESMGGSKYRVAAVDKQRLAFKSGVRIGDVIETVDGKRAGTIRDLTDQILAALDMGTAPLGITRAGKKETLFLRGASLPQPKR